jgi:hypothetical protein
MRNAVETIGNLIDKQSVSLIGSIDGDGFLNRKAIDLLGNDSTGLHDRFLPQPTSLETLVNFREYS